ncbi:hypothetical protein GSI_04624 [Ganoderma sinense ZZ0214-1]|uniref:Uncharacterized protein n=1 Tax=Ganoderma sinense ZZ0214-1 TaxID=1077348 RepID=A0A2G8SHC3_9APHY|nr:hypothetical protein GSI_04624 [Ganoderma sinense ZZ0214-1]
MDQITISLYTVPGHDSVPPDTIQPLCFTAYPIACREDTTIGNDSEVDWSVSLVGNPLNVSDSDQVPDTPRHPPFLDFDNGVDVNGSDFNDVDFEDPDYQTASGSTLEASTFWSEDSDVDAVEMSISSSTVIATVPPPMLNRIVPTPVPPQFGPMIPE